jgi:hypothetical protein
VGAKPLRTDTDGCWIKSGRGRGILDTLNISPRVLNGLEAAPIGRPVDLNSDEPGAVVRTDADGRLTRSVSGHTYTRLRRCLLPVRSSCRCQLVCSGRGARAKPHSRSDCAWLLINGALTKCARLKQ